MNILIPDIDTYMLNFLDLPELLQMACVNKFFNRSVNSVQIVEQCQKLRYYNTNDVKFYQACVNGYLTFAKYILCKFPDMEIDRFDVFSPVCNNNHIDVAKWLVQAKSDGCAKIIIGNNIDAVFRISCKTNHTEMAKWLICLGESAGYAKINIDATIFQTACWNNQIELATWLAKLTLSDTYSSINIDVLQEIFTWACYRGQLEIAKLIMQMDNIDIHLDNEGPFILSCTGGHINVAKWLVDLGGVDININNNDAFQTACANGFIAIAKWLIQLGESGACSKIDIDVLNRSIRMAKINSHTEIVEWLRSIKYICV